MVPCLSQITTKITRLRPNDFAFKKCAIRNLRAFLGSTSGVLGFLPPDAWNGRDLFHPLRDQFCVDVVQRLEFHAPRRFAHRHWRDRRNRREVCPLMNMSLTWPSNPPQQKHQPSPTP